jgi:predicted ATPase/Tfp pilus assembly protein PilF
MTLAEVAPKYTNARVTCTSRSEGSAAMEDEGRASSSSDFGALLRQHRLAAGLSLESLAERARMSANGVGALERGYRRSPQRETLGLLADALGLDDAQRRDFQAAAARSALPRRLGGALATAASEAPGNLPLALTSFVGREVELQEIAGLVREHRLVTLTGTGGIGKTQTALRVVAGLGDDGAVPVRFVGLALVASSSAVVAAIASAAGIREVPERALLETLLAQLAGKRMLLILDNCEHVVGEAAAVADAILTSCPGVRIVATSREPLRTAGERTYRLPSLKTPGAVALFADRAAAVDYRFAITNENAERVAELCTRLDGIPLAIELAAARINLFSVEGLIEKLDERLRLLSGGKRTDSPRQQTMRAAIDWSFNLLSAQEQRLFERLAVFLGGCTLDAVEAVASDTTLAGSEILDLLSSLTEKSLVVADADLRESRFRLLESTRAFALEKLDARGERSEFTRRHANWIARLAGRAWESARTQPTQPWAREYEPELENARGAIEWAIAAREASIAARIAGGFTTIWSMYRGAAEPRGWLESVLPLLDAASDPAIAAQAWRMLSSVTFGTHKIDAARRAIELDVRSGDSYGEVASLFQLSAGYLESGRIEEAREANDRALRICRENGLTHSRRYATALDVGARIAILSGKLDDARVFRTEALAIMRAIGDELDATTIRQNMGELEFSAGNVERALEHAEAAVAGARRATSVHREASALANAAACRLVLGDVDGARAAARASLALAKGVQPLVAAIAMQHLATVAALRGDPTDGARLRGYVDWWYRSEGCERDLTEQRTDELLLATLSGQLDDAKIRELAAQGAGLSEQQAVDEALAI